MVRVSPRSWSVMLIVPVTGGMSWALLGPELSAIAAGLVVAFAATEMVRVSPRSWSVMLIVPVTGGMSWALLGPELSAIAAGLVAASMAGVSLVPVIVITRFWVLLSVVPSLTLATKVRVRVSPARSQSRSAAAGL